MQKKAAKRPKAISDSQEQKDLCSVFLILPTLNVHGIMHAGGSEYSVRQGNAPSSPELQESCGFDS